MSASPNPTPAPTAPPPVSPARPVSDARDAPGMSENRAPDSRASDEAFEHLSMEVSAVCDLRCAQCSLDDQHENSGVMDWPVFERLEPLLHEFRSLDFGTTGESFMNRRLLEMLRRARRAAPGAHMHAQTNGMSLDENACLALVNAGLDVLVVSADSAEPESFARIRRGGRLSTLVDGLRRLQRARRRAASPVPRVHLTFTLMRSNAAELEGVIDLAADLGIQRVNVNNVEVYSEDMCSEAMYLGAGEKGPRVQADPRAAWLARAARERARLRAVDLHLPEFTPREISPCRFAFPSVSWDGEVTPCAALSYRRRFLHPGAPAGTQPRWAVVQRVSFGNVLETPLSDIWRSESYSRFRRCLRAGRFPVECACCARRWGIICG